VRGFVMILSFEILYVEPRQSRLFLADEKGGRIGAGLQGRLRS